VAAIKRRALPGHLIAVILVGLAVGPVLAQGQTTYHILFNGRKAGTETVVRDMPEQGAIRDKAHVEFSTPAGVPVVIDTVFLLREQEERIRPARFSLEAKNGSQTYAVQLEFQKGRAEGTLRQGDGERRLNIEVGESFTLLENNVFHPYQSLYRRYNFSAGGVQRFTILTPSAGAVLEAVSERKGNVRVKREGGTELIEQVAVSLGGVDFQLYGTRGGKFLFLDCEDQRMRVALSGYEEVVVSPARK
jgi:hypothetical protein